LSTATSGTSSLPHSGAWEWFATQKLLQALSGSPTSPARFPVSGRWDDKDTESASRLSPRRLPYANVMKLQATSSYLPGSQKSLPWAPEMIMLFWEALQCNKRFRSFIIDTDRAHDFVVLVLYYAIDQRNDLTKQGLVRMCIFVLQTMSAEPNFGKTLNKAFEGQDSLPASIRIPNFHGTYADYLITVRRPSAWRVLR
jgi:hypothetical protein